MESPSFFGNRSKQLIAIEARIHIGSSFHGVKAYRRNLVYSLKYAVDIRIIWLCNGLTIRHVEDRQALLELFVVFNG